MISVICNQDKKRSSFVFETIKQLSNKYNYDYFFIDEFPILSKDYMQTIQKSELLIIVGGDGTILSALFYLNYKVPPIIAINSGSLGFIASTTIKDFKDFLVQILEKKKNVINIDKRYLIETFIDGKKYYALNDFVLQKSNRQKMLDIECSFNDIPILRSKMDGAIISSPTGSTAYNLSAGGAIMCPTNIPAMIFTPICPHSLTIKSIIIPKSDDLLMRATHYRDIKRSAYLVVDGVKEIEIKPNKEIQFKVSKKKIIFYRRKEDNYYMILNKKMKWAI